MTQIKFIQNQIFHREEGKDVEFKTITSSNPVKTIVDHAEKYIVGFLNASVEGDLYCGINDFGEIVGVTLDRTQRDKMQQDMPNKLKHTDPPISKSFYEILYNNVYNEENNLIENLYIVQIQIQEIDINRDFLYKTSGGIFYYKKGTICSSLNSEEIAQEYKNIHQKQLKKAMEEVDEKLEKNPEDYSLLRKKADLATFMGDIETMKETFEKLIESNPKNPKTRQAYASAYESIDNPEEALSILDDTIQLFPKNPDILKQKGATLVGLDRMPEALKIYQTALKNNPDDYTILTQIGILYRTMGNYKDSIYFLNSALVKSPNYRVAKYEKKRTYSKMFEGGIGITKNSKENQLSNLEF